MKYVPVSQNLVPCPCCKHIHPRNSCGTAQTDSKGQDFWLTFPPNFHSSPARPAFLFIFIVADEPTSGAIEYYDQTPQCVPIRLLFRILPRSTNSASRGWILNCAALMAATLMLMPAAALLVLTAPIIRTKKLPASRSMLLPQKTSASMPWRRRISPATRSLCAAHRRSRQGILRGGI